MTVEMKFVDFVDGFRCHYQHWIPKHPKALVVMLHGLGDHIGRYNELVSHLACNGYACALYDQRGHGMSSGRRGNFGHFDNLILDLQNFIEFSSAKIEGDVPLFLVGGSLGGLVCLNFLIKTNSEISGVVLISPAILPNIRIPSWKKSVARILGSAVPFITVDNGLELKALTSDEYEVSALASDNMFHTRISLGSAVDVEKKLQSVMAISYRVKVPVLILVGSEDVICNPTGAMEFYDKIAFHDKEFISYEGMKHDLLHDADRNRIMDDMEKWLSLRCKTWMNNRQRKKDE